MVNPPPNQPSTSNLTGYILAFFISALTGLIPYLGKLKIPVFDFLLTLIPDNLQSTILPLSAIVMGLVAIVIQWHGSDKFNDDWLREWFSHTILIAAVTFLILLTVHIFVVVKVQTQGGKESETALIGFNRPARCPCAPDISNSQCISQHVSLDPIAIETCWGSTQIHLAQIALILPYLGFTGCFGLLVGLLTLRSKAK